MNTTNIINSNKVVELLKVFLNTRGDFRSVKPIPFMDRGVILFTTKVFLDAALLKGNNISLKHIFLNYEVFYNALKLLKSEDYASYTPEQIFTNNLEVFRKAFLSEKTQIPIGSKKMAVVKSKLAKGSFRLDVSNNARLPRNTIRYEATFDVTILDTVRDLKDGDFKRANCRIKANELNTQAMDIFGLDLGLDDEYPPIKRSILKPPSGVNQNDYNSSYASSPYGSSSPYGMSSSPYGMSSSPYGMSSSPYGMSSPYGSTNTFYNNNNNTNADLSKARREISLLLKEQEKELERKRKEYYETEWLNYQGQRRNEGLPVMNMNDWLADRDIKQFVNIYKTDWLKYKEEQEASGKKPDVEKWRKNKLEQENLTESDFYAKKWLDYKSDQTVLGNKPIMIDWLKTELKKYKTRNSPENMRSEYMGGKYMRSEYMGGKYMRSDYMRSDYMRSEYMGGRQYKKKRTYKRSNKSKNSKRTNKRRNKRKNKRI